MDQPLHPGHFAPALLSEHLEYLCEKVISVAHDSLDDSKTIYDTDYTRGTLIYGRLQGLCREMSKDKSIPWFQLCNATMDFTVSVNGVLLQLVTDNPDAPKKAHRLKASEMEQSQLSLFQAMPEVCTWRLFVDSNNDLEFPEFEAAIVGFDVHQNILCHWKYDQGIRVSVRALNLAPAEELEEGELHRRSREFDVQDADDADPINE